VPFIAGEVVYPCSSAPTSYHHYIGFMRAHFSAMPLAEVRAVKDPIACEFRLPIRSVRIKERHWHSALHSRYPLGTHW